MPTNNSSRKQIRCFFISCKLILYTVNFIYTLSRDESTYICPSHLKDVKMDERSITLNLQLLRLRRGLTQDNVAEAAGITRVAYSHLETGKVKILHRKISRIAEILGVSLEELLLGYQPEPEASGRLHELSAGDDEKYSILSFAWVPEDTIEIRSRKDHVNYDLWLRQGIYSQHRRQCRRL